ncbi:hypothetical protein [Acidithiobacillus sulfurivorans]|jgi:hypothetical protein|uniref:Uncharacterized protein n=1 Tax=Acidithiobacillus sulfurivorans TaxID=1958756 RepID=A0ABS5ZXK8_9PROT|nr:hypothetical protein [Acidithiobacillus sulfurivorans]MBU2759971.1 hypothetical protein [Acidithiobacillus sulfurivorans]
MKDIWEPVCVGMDIIRENDKNGDFTALPMILVALQKGVEIAWENPSVAEQILRLNENEMTTQILALLSRPCS